MKIFLDDTRKSPVGFQTVRTVEDFETLINEHKNDIEVISLDYDLSASGTGRTGYNACDFLVKNNINCPKIIIHSTHPNAEKMYSYLTENLPSSSIEMKKYSILEVMKGYEN